MSKTRRKILISEVMTAQPHTLPLESRLKDAARLMWENGIRHLPVVDGNKLVGIVSDRDIHIAESLAGSAEMRMELVMTPVPYCVPPDASVEEVAHVMIENKYGAAIVVDEKNQAVVGIFTTIDALRLLVQSLRG